MLQERLLSPRTVYFTAHKVYWECETIIQDNLDTNPITQGDGGRHHDDWVISSSKRRFDFAKSDEPPHTSPVNESASTSPSTMLSYWARLIASYRATSLSNSGDMLVAISGLAQHYADHTKDRYVAGLWQRSLIGQLMWFVGPSGSTRAAVVYRAPSWSWAAWDIVDKTAQHHTPEFFRDPVAHIADLRMTLEDGGSTVGSEVSEVVLVGPSVKLHKAEIVKLSKPRRLSTTNLDTALASSSDSAEALSSHSQYTWTTSSRVFLDGHPENLPQCLTLVLAGKRYGGNADKWFTYTGLLLDSVEMDGSICDEVKYMRAGVWESAIFHLDRTRDPAAIKDYQPDQHPSIRNMEQRSFIVI